MKNWLRAYREWSLARAEKKADRIQDLIENGHLGWLTTFRLNSVCRRIEKLDAALKSGK